MVRMTRELRALKAEAQAQVVCILATLFHSLALSLSYASLTVLSTININIHSFSAWRRSRCCVRGRRIQKRSDSKRHSSRRSSSSSRRRRRSSSAKTNDSGVSRRTRAAMLNRPNRRHWLAACVVSLAMQP
jgi:hypothetical protein